MATRHWCVGDKEGRGCLKRVRATAAGRRAGIAGKTCGAGLDRRELLDSIPNGAGCFQLLFLISLTRGVNPLDVRYLLYLYVCNGPLMWEDGGSEPWIVRKLGL